MLALGLKTKKRHIRSPNGRAAAIVQRDGFCNPRGEMASLPTWLGRVGVREAALVSQPCSTIAYRIDPVTRRQPLKYFMEVLGSPASILTPNTSPSGAVVGLMKGARDARVSVRAATSL